MPIYAYRCEACGHAKDVLQKVSDPVLTTCPACGAEAFAKQVTAAGFQLKGSGWYVTDFRGGAGGKKGPGKEGAEPAAAKPAGDAAAKGSEPAAAPAAGTSPAASTGTSSSGGSSSDGGSSSGGGVSAAGSCGTSCGCH
jgi:putative FmdB family regulatory protein